MKQAAPEFAETVAVMALGWLAGNDELLPVFLGTTGTSLSEMRERADDPAFLRGILDFVLMDDEWVRAFCESAGLDYDAPMRARQSLPGGAEPNWT